MSTVQRLEQALKEAKELGAEIYYDMFDGHGGGHCTVGGKVRIYLDLAQSSGEQLEVVMRSLEELQR